MNIELIIISVCGVISFFFSIDLLSFIIKRAPVKLLFASKFYLYFGLLNVITVVYFILNEYRFF